MPDEISSEAYNTMSYDGKATAVSSAKLAEAESGAWDASVNVANPRTRNSTESAYSKMDIISVSSSLS